MGKKNDPNETADKIGIAFMTLSYILFALKFIAVTSLIALGILWLIHKPLWIAPIVGVLLFLLYRALWRLFFRFVNWSTKK